MGSLSLVVGLPLAGIHPGPGPARDWLRHELAGPEYRPSLTERFWHAVQDLFDRVREATLGAGGFDPVVAFAVLLVLAVLLGLVLSRLRANPRGAEEPHAVFTERRLSADDHRERSRQALERGEWRAVVVESTRAVAAGLFERGLVVEEPGTTADEIAAAAGVLFPALGDRLRRAAVLFDETMYGDRAADEPRAREVSALEHDLRSAVPATSTARGPVVAVPR